MSELIFVLNNARWPVLVLDEDGNVYHRNPAAEKIFGPQPSGDTALFSTIWAAENKVALKDFLTDTAKTTDENPMVKFKSKSGLVSFAASLCTFNHDNQTLEVLQLFPPSAEVKAGGAAATAPSAPPASPAATAAPTMEANIAHKQKLECALQLARTVAMDFNNALTSILGHTSLILGRMQPNHPWHASLVEVEKSASRAAEIASDLAAFSRQEKEARGQTAGNLNHLLQRTADMFKTTAPDKLVWNLQLARKLYAAKFDEAKMQQVFVKIIENAIQSFDSGSGKITLQTRNLDLSAPTQDRNAQLAPGSYVCAEITDNGCGIAPEVLPRVFEPFFTTKRAPAHRGLGLAWAYGVVTNHGGGVAVSSQPGAGTAVRIYLPTEKKFIQDGGFSDDDLKGDQTILMVDDEDLLLTMGQAILSSFGYRVLTANNGQRALEILTQSEPQIDLLITDLVMPGMSGRELMSQTRQLSAETRVLCTSGYVFPGKGESEDLYLQKPFTSRELLLKVKHALTVTEVLECELAAVD